MDFLNRIVHLGISTMRARTHVRGRGNRMRNGPGVVLAYAGVNKKEAPKFRDQMEWLAAHCVVQPLRDIISTPRAMCDRPRVAITFDGAYDSVYRNAIPVLSELGFSATVFAVSGSLGRTPSWDTARNDSARSEIVMTVGQLSSLRRDLFEVGSLTETHARLDRLTPEQIRGELLNSRNDLSAALARPVTMLSVPYGIWNAQIIGVAGELGYESVVTLNPRLLPSGSVPIVAGRVALSPNDWAREFTLKVRGAYGLGRRRRWRNPVKENKQPDQSNRLGQPIQPDQSKTDSNAKNVNEAVSV